VLPFKVGFWFDRTDRIYEIRYKSCGDRVDDVGHQKPLFRIGRSYEDLLDCPDEVRRTFGFALGLA